MGLLGSVGNAIKDAIDRATSSSSGNRSGGSSGSSSGSRSGSSASRARSSGSSAGSRSTSSGSGATAYNMRNYLSNNGQSAPGWDATTGTVTINGNSYKTGSIPGTYYDAGTNTHYVTNRSVFDSIANINSNPAQPQQDEQVYDEMYDDPTSDYINQLAEAQRRSRISALDNARTTALSSLDSEKAGVAPVYYDKRNQVAAQSDVGAMNFANYMAARGIKGAAGAMPEIYRQAGLQGQIGALDRQEASELGAIERQRANIESGYASDVAAAEADVDAQTMQSQISQWNTDRSYALQKAAQDYEIKKGNEERARSVEDTKKQEWISTIGQYNNDYAAQISAVQNDGDTTNDWQIPYLQTARNKKLAEIQEAQVKAAQQEIENQQKWAQINKTGSKGGGSDTTTTDTTPNPFDDPNDNVINGYAVTRLDNYITDLAKRNGNTTDKSAIRTAIQNTQGLNDNFKAALLSRLDSQ